jgi:putative peptidoglycan lipid II flippase
MFNMGIIVFGIVLPTCFGMGIESQAWGALVGAIIGSLAIQMRGVLRHGLSLQPLWDLKDAGVHKVLASLAPIVFGLASGQIIALNLPRFVAYRAATELPAIGYANRLMQVPLDLLASGPAIALFPTLALLFAQRKIEDMRGELAGALRRTLVLTILATALLAALRFPIVHFLLEHGDFSKADSKDVAPVLGCYAFCIVGLGAQQVLARGFYAMGEFVAPIIIGIVAMIVFAIMTQLVPASGAQGAAGLAVAAAIAVTILGALLWISLKSKLRGWDKGATSRTFIKSLVAGAACYQATLVTARLCFVFTTAAHLDQASTHSVLKYAARGGVVGVAAIVGTLAFVVVGAVIGLREVDAVKNRFSRRRPDFVPASYSLEKSESASGATK